jgi:hypothetical protein
MNKQRLSTSGDDEGQVTSSTVPLIVKILCSNVLSHCVSFLDENDLFLFENAFLSEEYNNYDIIMEATFPQWVLFWKLDARKKIPQWGFTPGTFAEDDHKANHERVPTPCTARTSHDVTPTKTTTTTILANPAVAEEIRRHGRKFVLSRSIARQVTNEANAIYNFDQCPVPFFNSVPRRCLRSNSGGSSNGLSSYWQQEWWTLGCGGDSSGTLLPAPVVQEFAFVHLSFRDGKGHSWGGFRTIERRHDDSSQNGHNSFQISFDFLSLVRELQWPPLMQYYIELRVLGARRATATPMQLLQESTRSILEYIMRNMQVTILTISSVAQTTMTTLPSCQLVLATGGCQKLISSTMARFHDKSLSHPLGGISTPERAYSAYLKFELVDKNDYANEDNSDGVDADANATGGGGDRLMIVLHRP